MMWMIPWIFLLLGSCSPNSSEDFHREGGARSRSLVNILSQIENREQLLKAEPLIKKHFESLVTLMIEARDFEQKHLDDEMGEIALDEEAPQHLLEEQLRRVYAIEGAREVIERTQQEALIRLDAHERTLIKKRAQLR
jgi:hypothetical protein